MDRSRNFAFLLKDLSRRYAARFETHAHRLSLTLMQCRALWHLAKCEGVSQARLAEIIDIEPMMMVRLLDRMEADKLIERRVDPADRRARRLYLTRKAKPMLDEIWRLGELTRTEIFAGISRVDRDKFEDVLQRIHANACAFDMADAAGEARPASKRTARSQISAARLTRQ